MIVMELYNPDPHTRQRTFAVVTNHRENAAAIVVCPDLPKPESPWKNPADEWLYAEAIDVWVSDGNPLLWYAKVRYQPGNKGVVADFH